MTLESVLRSWNASLSEGTVWAAAVALVGGVVASAVCPCTLPVGLGVASAAGASEGESRSQGLRIAAAFFSGIVVNLAVLGAVAARLGGMLTETFGKYWALAMALASLLAAALAFSGPRLSAGQLSALRRPGVAGAFAYGFIFSLGTSAGPLLLLLTVSAAQAEPLNGLVLATAFGIGRGLPFLAVGIFAGLVVRFTRVGAWRRPLQWISGSALLVVSAYYVRTFVSIS